MSSTHESSRKRHDRRQHHHRKKKSKKHHSTSSDETETSERDTEDSSSSTYTSDDDDTGKAKVKKSSKRKRQHHETKSKKRKTSKHDKKHKHKKRKKEKQDPVNRSSEKSTFGPIVGPAIPSVGATHVTKAAAASGLKSSESSQKGSVSSGRSMVPMTKEQYEKQQSVIRRVFDPETGRSRLVKGDGEIVEEIVSREQQKAINKRATLGDSLSFQAGLKKYM